MKIVDNFLDESDEPQEITLGNKEILLINQALGAEVISIDKQVDTLNGAEVSTANQVHIVCDESIKDVDRGSIPGDDSLSGVNQSNIFRDEPIVITELANHSVLEEVDKESEAILKNNEKIPETGEKVNINHRNQDENSAITKFIYKIELLYLEYSRFILNQYII